MKDLFKKARLKLDKTSCGCPMCKDSDSSNQNTRSFLKRELRRELENEDRFNSNSFEDW